MPGKYAAYWELKDDRTGTPVVGRRYKLALASGPSHTDTTDVTGWTRVIYTDVAEAVTLTVYEQTTIAIE